MKDELIQQLRLLGMGRVNAAYAIADILMPADVHLDKAEDASPVDEVKAETVEIEVVAPPPDPAPAKPKRKKA